MASVAALALTPAGDHAGLATPAGGAVAGIKIGTFNCENLFARFKFNKDVDPEMAVQDGWDANRTHFNILNDVEKHITALAIKGTKADVLALQEVENLATATGRLRITSRPTPG